jgi:hypothetical protein
MKDTQYFPHDTNARNDTKIQKLLMKHGMAGIGLYWCLIEMLYEQDGKLPLADMETYAFALRSDSEFLNEVISGFGLFKKNKSHFWSESANKRLNEIKNRSNSARRSAYARWGNANAMQSHNDSNAIKESKVKESKRKSVSEIRKENGI